MIQDERHLLLAGIAANPDDLARYLIFADFLDEQGEADLADFYRRGPMALRSRKWLQEFANANWCEDDVDEDYGYSIPPDPYEHLMEACARFVESGETTSVGNNEMYGYNISRGRDEFWQHYENVTGKKVPEKRSIFRCAC